MERNDEFLKGAYRSAIFQGSESRPDAGRCRLEQEVYRFFRPKTSRKTRLAIVDHVTSCQGCARLFQFLLDLERKEKELAAAIEAGSPQRPAGFFRAGFRELYPAIGLILVLALSIMLIIGRPGKGSSDYRAGGGQIHLLSPRGETRMEGLTFRWNDPAGHGSYILEICDEALRPIWKSEELLATTLILPGAVKDRLTPGSSYFWMVTDVSSDGRARGSGMIRFVVQAGRE